MHIARIARIARISVVLVVSSPHIHHVADSWGIYMHSSHVNMSPNILVFNHIKFLPSLFLLLLAQRSNTMDSPATTSRGPFLQGSVSSFRKLSNFFGEEPPRLEDLESFLERLGYSHLTQVGGVAGHVTGHVICITQLFLCSTIMKLLMKLIG